MAYYLDPHHFTRSGFAFYPAADPDSDFYLIRIRISAYRLIFYTFWLVTYLQMDVDPDPAYHFDTDPDPDFYLMRIRIRIFIWCGSWFSFDADPEADPCYQNDADPQHCFSLTLADSLCCSFRQVEELRSARQRQQLMVENIIQQRDLYKSMCTTTQKEATAMVAPTAAAATAVQKKTPVKAAEGGSGDAQRVQAWTKNMIKNTPVLHI
jgi:hypothetical protein